MVWRLWPSRTAEAVCFFRALENLRPAQERIVSDPYAYHFLGPGLRLALTLFEKGGPLLLGSPVGTTRLATFVQCRHRFIDDALLSGLEAGAQTVVLLGAGYDMRALRFAEQLQGITVYEVDEPATQNRKLRFLQKIGTRPGDHVQYLGIDFEKESFADKLIGAGIRKEEPAIFIWEGVSMYLSLEVVEDVLKMVRDIGGVGTRLLLDFWFQPEEESLSDVFYDLGRLGLVLVGEKLRFMLRPDALTEFVGPLGYRVVEVAGAEALQLRYDCKERQIYPGCYTANLIVGE